MVLIRFIQDIEGIYRRSLYILSAIVLALSASLASYTPANATGTFSSQPAPSAYSSIADMTAANGLLWTIAVPNGGTVGNHIFSMSPSGTTTDYNIAALSGLPGMAIGSIITGSDGNVWFTGIAVAGVSGSGIVIGKINVSTGSVTTYPGVISNTNNYGFITSDADGNIWYKAKSTGTPAYTYLESLNPSTGVTTTVYTFDEHANVYYIASMGGKVWTIDSYYHSLRSFTTSGAVDTYTIPSPNDTPNYLTSSSDGALWFTKGSSIIKFTTSSGFTTYALPAGTSIYRLVPGADGTMWFVDNGTTRSIGKITSSGSITEYPVPAVGTPVILGLALGPAGAVWFPYSDSNVKKIGRFDEATSQTVSFTSTAPTNATVGGATYTPTATATSGLAVTITVDSSASGVCSINSSGVVSFQAGGTCVLNANQAGDSTYDAAPQVQQSFTVVNPNADISAAYSCPSTATVGAVVTCTITISNAGPATSTGVIVGVNYSSNRLSGVTATLSSGTKIGPSGGLLYVYPGNLASGASMTITINGTASAVGTANFNTTILTSSPDPNLGNNVVGKSLVIS